MATTKRVEMIGVLAAIFAVLVLVATTATGLVRIEVPAVVGDAFGWARIAAAAALAAWVFVQRETE